MALAAVLCIVVTLGALGAYARSRPALLRYRTFWRRFWAGFVDAIVLSPLAWVDYLVVTRCETPVICVVWFFVRQVSYAMYSVVLHGLYGQTIGKRLLAVKVLSAAETPITFRHALLRDAPLIAVDAWTAVATIDLAVRCVDTYANPEAVEVGNLHVFGSLWFAVELITMLTHSKRRALHDLIAGTVVVRVSEPAAAG